VYIKEEKKKERGETIPVLKVNCFCSSSFIRTKKLTTLKATGGSHGCMDGQRRGGRRRMHGCTNGFSFSLWFSMHVIVPLSSSLSPVFRRVSYLGNMLYSNSKKAGTF
jgi:hypothetical protein